MHTGCALEDIFSKSTVHSASRLEEDRNMKVSLAFPGCCFLEQHTEEKPIVYMLLELMILYCIEQNQTKPTMYSKQGKRWVQLCTSYTISGKEQTWSSAKCDSFHVRKAGPWVVTSPEAGHPMYVGVSCQLSILLLAFPGFMSSIGYQSIVASKTVLNLRWTSLKETVKGSECVCLQETEFVLCFLVHYRSASHATHGRIQHTRRTG